MILVLGGTTEGRKAVEVLEEAGGLYYYSTRGDGQQIEMVNGIRLKGEMAVPQMMDCCRRHGIRLIVDAAHPFAEELHRNLLLVASHIGVPVIRYDRIWPPRDPALIWCRDWDEAVALLEEHHVERLLALTGVNTIGRLRPYWQSGHEVWFRILNRRASRDVALANRFPEERLVYYEHDDTKALIEKLRPDAIITKESGSSGGFTEKVATARAAGLRVFVVERPVYPPPLQPSNPRLVHIESVNGPHGLRRAVEKLLPQFFPLHSGLTTGTCATAAAVAAALRQLSGVTPHEVPVLLPDGETVRVPVSYADGYAACVKEAGDDPDVTNGIEIRASVEAASHFSIEGGAGVGRFTLPGFDFPPGEPAINKAPREMIRRNVMAVADTPLRVTISVPQGAEVARRTFNPRLGIEGGISIIGVSGIVKPYSEEAFVDSIRKCMEVAKASGTERVVINSGAKSERFLKALYPDLPAQAFVQYGNYIGQTLRFAAELSVKSVTLGVMLGKAVKLAQGHLDTHSRRATLDLAFVCQMLHEAAIAADISGITLARELWDRLPAGRAGDFARVVILHCREHCAQLFPGDSLTILLIDDNGNIYGK